MKFEDLNKLWKRIFQLEWESVCEKSKAIAALIVDENDEIISEGRNKIGEQTIPNPKVAHAEVEAIRNLNIERYPNVKTYTLYAALEPCPMCMGTMVMGGIRKVVIGAHDDHGGAMDLLKHSQYLQHKRIQVIWMPQEYGDIQRGLQTIKELLFNQNKELLERKLTDFSVYNSIGVEAAKLMVGSGLFSEKTPKDYTIEFIFNTISELIAKPRQ